LVWVRNLRIRDLRNIAGVAVDLDPGLNVFSGRNAQGKTSLLEAVGLLARGRSFRTEDPLSMIRHGAAGLLALGETVDTAEAAHLEVELSGGERRLRVDGRDVAPRDYHGRLEVVVYSTERLRIVGSMRDRRQLLDRSAGALWPSYRADHRAFERVLAQRNAVLVRRGRDLGAWTDRFVETGARLRQRRATYAARLSGALREGFRPSGESYEVRVASPAGEPEAQDALRRELEALHLRELAAARSLAGPHRDPVALLVDGKDAADGASSGQARSLLLALALATLRIYREETGRAAVALLDDLDSELDAERAGALCAEVVEGGQALVTSAHPTWADSLRPLGRVFCVEGGGVRGA